jgi:hypothetical protein
VAGTEVYTTKEKTNENQKRSIDLAPEIYFASAGMASKRVTSPRMLRFVSTYILRSYSGRGRDSLLGKNQPAGSSAHAIPAGKSMSFPVNASICLDGYASKQCSQRKRQSYISYAK